MAALLVTLLVFLGLGTGSAVAAARPTEKVLVWSRANDNDEGAPLASLLGSMGYEVTNSATLPSQLGEFRSIWSVVAYEGLNTEEQERIEGYVRAGGSLYLTGERPCCEELNLTDQQVLRTLLDNKNIVVGQQGDIGGTLTFNPNALDGISTKPNVLGEAPAASPGGVVGIGNITQRNVLASVVSRF
jgi:hypothetical protein